MFGGRTERAELYPELVQFLKSKFPSEKVKEVLWGPNKYGDINPVKVVMYGEGVSFRLFDVLVGNRWWLRWEDVENIAKKFKIKTAPYLGEWTLDEIVEEVKMGIPSVVSVEDSNREHIAEGIVGRTIEPMFDRRGRRIILKLKTSDYIIK